MSELQAKLGDDWKVTWFIERNGVLGVRIVYSKLFGRESTSYVLRFLPREISAGEVSAARVLQKFNEVKLRLIPVVGEVRA